MLSEQNWGPRINRFKNQWISPTGIPNTGTEQVVGNNEGYYPASVIDEYNRVDFPTSYDHARFFVIKSYSEDDVHKSIKYRVWSSTPNGNKRLDGAYHDVRDFLAFVNILSYISQFINFSQKDPYCMSNIIH